MPKIRLIADFGRCVVWVAMEALLISSSVINSTAMASSVGPNGRVGSEIDRDFDEPRGGLNNLSDLPAFNSEANPFLMPQSSDVFSVGEHIDYDIRFWGLQVGEMSLKILPALNFHDRQTYHFLAESELNVLFFRGLYRVNSWVDRQTFKPLNMHMRQISKKRGVSTFSVTEIYDWFSLQAFYEQQVNKKNYEDISPIRNFSQNSLSLFYFVRTLPLHVGFKYRFPVTTKGRNRVAQLDVEGFERMCTRARGCQQALKLNLQTILWHLNEPQERRVRMWLSLDSRRQILKFKSSAVSVTALAIH